MLLFIPYEDFTETAKVLHHSHLILPCNQAFILVKSIARCYDVNPRTNQSGFENHTAALFWKGHELSLANYGLALALELLKRHKEGSSTLEDKKNKVKMWKNIIERMEDADWPDTKPKLLGDEDFHSGFRSYLLFKECQALTFKNWKKGAYPDHAVTRNLLPSKRSWRRKNYEQIWEFFGMPDPVWYAQWGWEESPDDLKMFLTEDKKSQIQKEIQRKIDKPMVGWMMKKVEGKDT